MESATAWPFPLLRVASTTFAPALAKARAMPSPIPWPAPLTIATLSDRSTIMTYPPLRGFNGSARAQACRLQPHELRKQQGDHRNGDLQRTRLELVAGHHDRERQDQRHGRNGRTPERPVSSRQRRLPPPKPQKRGKNEEMGHADQEDENDHGIIRWKRRRDEPNDANQVHRGRRRLTRIDAAEYSRQEPGLRQVIELARARVSQRKKSA